MEKDFKNWHTRKKSIHENHERPFFHTREVWFCTLGANVGFEQDGVGEEFLRPVLIYKKFNNEITLAIPLTRAKKKPAPFYFAFLLQKEDRPSVAILSQIRLIDAKRLKYKIGDVEKDVFVDLKKKLKQLLA